MELLKLNDTYIVVYAIKNEVNIKKADIVNGIIICRKNDIFLCNFPAYNYTIYKNAF